MEAVKQGAAAVGVASSTHVVLVALKRTPGELASYQKKLIMIDDHLGVALAGLTSDARVLTKYMQAQALASRMNMNRALPVQRIVTDISDKAQTNTQEYGGRPFGVGLLVAGYDVWARDGRGEEISQALSPCRVGDGCPLVRVFALGCL